MARNGSGTYSKVNTFTSGTTITASSHNANWDDAAAEITNSVAADGQSTMTGPLKASAGSAAAPSHTFGSDPDTGAYRSAGNEYSVAAGGTRIVKVTSAGIDVTTGTVLIAGVAAFPVPTAQIADKAITLSKLYHPTTTSVLFGSDSNAALTITGAASNGGPNLIRLSVASTTTFATSQVKTVSDVLGTTEANGTWTITVVDATHIDLQGSTFTNAYVSGGTIGGGVEEISLGTGLSLSGSVLVGSQPLSGAQGLVITNNTGTPNSIIDISADQAVMSSGSATIYATAVSISINTGTIGAANGLDAGSRASSTWYNLFLINNGTTTAGLASLSATAPTMPSGYTYLVRVGAMRTDGSGNFLRSRQQGNKTTNLTTVANLPDFGIGNVGSTYTALSVTTFVPPTAVSIFVRTFSQSNGVGASYLGVAGYQAGTAPSTQPYPESFFEVNGAAVLMNSVTPEIFLLSTNIYYAAAAMTTVNLGAAGWRDKVNAT